MCNTKFGEELRLHCFWVAACAASVISGFVAGWVWRDRPEALANVSVLSALTAFGTVGAVAVALWQTHRLERRKQREDFQRVDGVLSIINEAVFSLLWVADHLRLAARDRSVRINEEELNAFRHSASVVFKIPFHEDPYCRIHPAILFCLSDLNSATSKIERVQESIANDAAEAISTVADHALEDFKQAFQHQALHGHKMPSPPYFISRLLRVAVSVRTA
ncbi:hypothetical protein [Bordetella trematum]|uniref:hypothetical protein n=1 Tax=Bordetella trematum TaxID=123899 RepID=UPI0004AEEC54|nr:hypothetical protein [Bordetella trematum]